MSTAASDNEPSANPWLPLCLARLAALDDPSIPLTEVKVRYAQEFRWIEEAKSAVRSQLNTHSPIARLVPEVLAHVFRLLADVDEPRVVIGLRCAPRQDLGWITVTHVCRSWRIIALNYPDLWARNVCSLTSWTEERLRRSMEAPIDVFCSLQGPILGPSLIAHAYRIKQATFHSRTSWEATDRYWQKLLASSVQSLASFTYIFSNQKIGTSRHDVLPVNIFACSPPRLKVLSLRNALLPFESPVYQSLTHLYLEDYRYVTEEERTPFTREQLLALLSRMPELQTCWLCGVIPDRPVDVESTSAQLSSFPPEPVILHSLKALYLEDFADRCVWLAEQLSIPVAASFRVHCEPPYGSAGRSWGGSLDELLPFLTHHAGERDCVRPAQTLSIMVGPRWWRISCWKEFIYNAHPPTRSYFNDMNPPYPTQVGIQSGLPCCDIGVSPADADMEHVELVSMLRPLLTEIETSNIRVLDVGGGAFQIECTNWLELFASFTALEDLTLRCMVAFDFLEAFGLDLTLNLGTRSATGPADVPQVLFPNLRRLTFFRLDFQHLMGAADATLSELMITALTERQTMNTKLEEINLLECNWGRRWVTALGRIGPKVHYSGAFTEISAFYNLKYTVQERTKVCQPGASEVCMEFRLEWVYAVWLWLSATAGCVPMDSHCGRSRRSAPSAPQLILLAWHCRRL